MPAKRTPEQVQRAEIRRLRGSIARLERLLQSKKLTPSELISAERELRRASNALLRVERRGLLGRPKTATAFHEPAATPVPSMPAQIGHATKASVMPAAVVKRCDCSLSEDNPTRICDQFCEILGTRRPRPAVTPSETETQEAKLAGEGKTGTAPQGIAEQSAAPAAPTPAPAAPARSNALNEHAEALARSVIEAIYASTKNKTASPFEDHGRAREIFGEPDCEAEPEPQPSAGSICSHGVPEI